MKVRELLEELADVDPEAEVILQKDAEGNGYSPLRGVDPDAVYEAHCSYAGEVYSLHWTAEEADMPKAAWEAMKKEPRCVVLHPVN